MDVSACGGDFRFRNAVRNDKRKRPRTSESEEALLRRLCRARMLPQEGFEYDHHHYEHNHRNLRPAADGALRRGDSL